MDYIAEKMATVGAGAMDIVEAKRICDAMTKEQKDVLDCWHNMGIKQKMSEAYATVEKDLRDSYTEDDLIVLSAYVSARRNIEEY